MTHIQIVLCIYTDINQLFLFYFISLFAATAKYPCFSMTADVMWKNISCVLKESFKKHQVQANHNYLVNTLCVFSPKIKCVFISEEL